jgi:TatD DNase family protein
VSGSAEPALQLGNSLLRISCALSEMLVLNFSHRATILTMSFQRIDIHAHTNFAAYGEDRDAVIRRALDTGTAIINVGTQVDTSRSAVALAEAYDTGVYAIVGLHPVHTSASYHDADELGPDGSTSQKGFTSHGEEFDPAAYREFLRHPKVVAIGECGLDYFHSEPALIARQREAFLGQIALANEAGKPLMLHVRNSNGGSAYRDAVEMLRAHATVKGNSHFFAGTIEEAKLFLDLGYTMSFTGVITFARQYAELVEYVPLDMMHAETDCPYVTPVPHRGTRNEPAHVSYVYEKIAQVKKLSVADVESQLVKNAERMFGILLT